MIESIEEKIFKNLDWIEKNNFYGYDLFDGLCSPYSKYFTFNKKILRQVWQQFFKRCPVNLRPLFKIEKRVIPKSIADVVISLVKLSKIYNDGRYDAKLKCFTSIMLERAYQRYSGKCWGVGLVYQSRNVFTTPNIPNVITTYYCGMALLDMYEYTKETLYLDEAKSIVDFILNDVGYHEENIGICFNYFPGRTHYVHNANLLVATYLTRIGKIINDKNLIDLAVKAFQFTESCQNSDGSWYYGEESNHKWIDNFHTGYILDSYYLFKAYTGSDLFTQTLESGKKYYIENFFLNNTIPKYYNNKLYPVDMQCIAQSIQTLSLCYENSENIIKLINNIIEWTDKNMYSAEGYYYYQKNRFYTNKIPYMRWNQTTMLCGLSYYLYKIKFGKSLEDIK